MSSPRGSTASDEASFNGRMALEEVVQKLNDLDHNDPLRRASSSSISTSSSSSSMGKSGLGTRLPFLSALFATNRSSYSNSILTDEEDRNQEDNPWLDIFLWRFPLVSTTWFIVSQLLFFCLSNGLSMVTMWAVFALWQVLMDTMICVLVPKMQRQGLVNAEVDIHQVLRRNLFFSESSVKRGAGVFYELADLVVGLWRVTISDANLVVVLLDLRLGVLLLMCFCMSITTTLRVIILALFTIPISYQAQKPVADLVADGIQQQRARLGVWLAQIAQRDATTPLAKLNKLLASKLGEAL
ncbi:hypothetical protein BASA81_010071 [Batrachochytrium salamandrivorans]|nr:hypothetical protein BASA81_010071 [Batrachochytrium salamandrivorans]